MGLHFQQLLGWYQVAHFKDFEGKKILVNRDLKLGIVKIAFAQKWVKMHGVYDWPQKRL